MTDPSTMDWFHGRITRDTAERNLGKTALRDGTYLLRESTQHIGSYVLSVCKEKKFIHYQILKEDNGMVGINDGPKFIGPVELVDHHKTNLDGLLTKLTISCSRPAGVRAETYRNVSHEDLDQATREALRSEGIENEDAVRRFKGDIELVVGKILHKKQPWFHGVIPRDEADRRLHSQNCTNGLFLIRERGNPKGTYVLGICSNNKIYHYLFEKSKQDKLSIKLGRPFDNLMAVVNFYSQKSEGLLCKLQTPCDVAAFEYRPHSERSRNILLHPDIQSELRKALRRNEELIMYSKVRSAEMKPPIPRPISHIPSGPGPVNEAWKYEKIYDSANVIKMEGFNSPFGSKERSDISLDSRKLHLEHELGHGNFGSVMKGTYMLTTSKTLPVAVKTLKEEDIPGQKSEILEEANIMAKLDHPNIVRLVGIFHSPNFMIAMELAPAGPLHKYLKKHKDMPLLNILILMLQVDEGMRYLEIQHFVHRDLAARNVLVVSENFVKISDFGMSRTMGAGNEYYRAERFGKWPLKWYAPECIYYRIFTSKGDVWSYGITMWEAVTYGGKPYPGMKGPELVEKLEQGYRLPCPDGCPDEIYQLMRRCWEGEKDTRPTFSEIGTALSKYIESQRTKRR